jgi:type VI secretion system VgrG family protein
MPFTNQSLLLIVGGNEEQFLVEQISGNESMSGLFRFELELVSQDTEIELRTILASDATLTIMRYELDAGIRAEDPQQFAGVFAEFEQLEKGQEWTKYRAVLVPKIWRATRTTRSRIFVDKSVDELIDAVMAADPPLLNEGEYKKLLEEPDSAATSSGDGSDSDQARMDDDPSINRELYPQRQYTCQYEESDWDFLARWLEYEGVFFYFEHDHDAGEERIIFGDQSSSYGEESIGSFQYRPTSAGGRGDEDKSSKEEITSWRCSATPALAEVTINDQNYREEQPSVSKTAALKDASENEEEGLGRLIAFGNKARNEGQANRLTAVRLEESRCRSEVFHGEGSCRSFRPGAVFELQGLGDSSEEGDFVLVSVQHEAKQTISLDAGTVTGFKYQNAFTAIKKDRNWRPSRTTKWPTVHGVISAYVYSTSDDDGEMTGAPVDAFGRYLLRMPFEQTWASKPADSAVATTRYVRMAQPFAGANAAGMHFPLRTGTEVLVSFVDGDPDRPIIVGALPNEAQPGPVSETNPYQNSLKTNTGNRLVMDDAEGRQGVLITDANFSYVNDTRFHAGVKDSKIGDPRTSSDDPNQDLTHSWQDWARGNALASINDDAAADDDDDDDDKGNKYRSPDAQPAAKLGSSDWKEPTRIGDKVLFRDVKTGVEAIEAQFEKASNRVDKDELEKILERFVKASSDIYNEVHPFGDLGEDSPFKPMSFADANDFLSKIRNFEGKAFGSKLTTSIGDEWTVRIGDSYLYDDATRDITVGTGGFSWNEQRGDTEVRQYVIGEYDTTEKNWGKRTSKEVNLGVRHSESWSYDTCTDQSYNFFPHASFALMASAHTENTIDIGVYNSNALFVGAKAELAINLAGIATMEIDAGPRLSLELGPLNGKTTLNPRTWVHIAPTTTTTLVELETKLQATDAVCSRQGGVLNQNMAAIAKTNAALAETKSALNATRSALNTTMIGLNNAKQVMLDNNLAMVNSQTAAMRTRTSVLHNVM